MENISAELTWLILATSIALFAYGVIGRNKNTHRPPQVPYFLPWIGSAISMGKDPDAFVDSCITRYGSVFRVLVLGQEMTFVTDPSLISLVYRDSEHFDFSRIGRQYSVDIFGVPSDIYDSAIRRSYGEAQHRSLLPQCVRPMLRQYTEQAHKLFLEDIDRADGTSVDLSSFLIPPTYCSAATTMFGKQFPAEKSMPLFQTFDKDFPLMAAGLPRIVTRQARQAWDKLVVILKEYMEAVEHEQDIPEILRNPIHFAREGKWPLRVAASLLGIVLWALSANAPWVAYWLIVHAVQQPLGLAPLQEEVDHARKQWLASQPGTMLTSENFHDFIIESNDNFPLVTSVINETLRYTSASSSLREVRTPVELGGYHFETGEKVVVSARPVHMNEDIHPDPSSFKMDRYVDFQTPKKDGKLVTNHTLPFGGGVSMCTGRHFALSELKILMIVLLTYATIEVDPLSSQRPSFDWGRFGFGMLSAKGDMRVIIKKRKTA